MKQCEVEAQTTEIVVIALTVDQRLEGFQGLKRALEADRSRLDSMVDCSLSHDRADEVIGEDARPDFLVNKLRCLTSQHVHLHRGLDRAEIEFVVPSCPVSRSQIPLCRLCGIEQGGHDNNDPRSESRLYHANSRLPDREEVGQRAVSLPVERPNRRRFRPANDVRTPILAMGNSRPGFWLWSCGYAC